MSSKLKACDGIWTTYASTGGG